MTLPSRSHPRGAILLSLVLILGVVGTATLYLLAQSNLSGVVGTNDRARSAAVRAATLGCLDEALIQFTRDEDYAATSVVTPAATCDSAITNLGGTSRRIELEHASGNVTRRITAEITVDPVTVVSVLEQ